MRSTRKLVASCLPLTMGLIVVATTYGFGQAQQSTPTLVNPVPRQAPGFVERYLQRLTTQDPQKQNTGNSTPVVKVPNSPLRVVVPEVKTCSIPLLPVPIDPKQDFAIQLKTPVPVDRNFVISPSAPSCSLKP
jgi:hypothetical protein